MLSGIWKWASGAAVLAATVLYALLQKKRAEISVDKALRAEERAEKAHSVMQARDKARKEAEANAEKVRKDIRNRRAGLNNKRL